MEVDILDACIVFKADVRVTIAMELRNPDFMEASRWDKLYISPNSTRFVHILFTVTPQGHSHYAPLAELRNYDGICIHVPAVAPDDPPLCHMYGLMQPIFDMISQSPKAEAFVHLFPRRSGT